MKSQREHLRLQQPPVNKSNLKETPASKSSEYVTYNSDDLQNINEYE